MRHPDLDARLVRQPLQIHPEQAVAGAVGPAPVTKQQDPCRAGAFRLTAFQQRASASARTSYSVLQAVPFFISPMPLCRVFSLMPNNWLM